MKSLWGCGRALAALIILSLLPQLASAAITEAEDMECRPHPYGWGYPDIYECLGTWFGVYKDHPYDFPECQTLNCVEISNVPWVTECQGPSITTHYVHCDTSAYCYDFCYNSNWEQTDDTPGNAAHYSWCASLESGDPPCSYDGYCMNGHCVECECYPWQDDAGGYPIYSSYCCGFDHDEDYCKILNDGYNFWSDLSLGGQDCWKCSGGKQVPDVAHSCSSNMLRPDYGWQDDEYNAGVCSTDGHTCMRCWLEGEGDDQTCIYGSFCAGQTPECHQTWCQYTDDWYCDSKADKNLDGTACTASGGGSGKCASGECTTTTSTTTSTTTTIHPNYLRCTGAITDFGNLEYCSFTEDGRCCFDTKSGEDQGSCDDVCSSMFGEPTCVEASITHCYGCCGEGEEGEDWGPAPPIQCAEPMDGVSCCCSMPATTTVPTTSLPTTSLPTTSLPTTSVPTTSVTSTVTTSISTSSTVTTTTLLTGVTANVTVGNVPPTCTTAYCTVNTNDSDGTFTPSGKTNYPVWCTVVVSDSNGYQDISRVWGDYIHINESVGDAVDDDVHYKDLDCLSMNDGSGTSQTYNCSFADVKYYADEGTWYAVVNARDTSSAEITVPCNGSQIINSVKSIEVQGVMSFGTLNPGTTDNTLDTEFSINNTGNIEVNISLQADSDFNCTAGSIPATNVAYDMSEAVSYENACGSLSTSMEWACEDDFIIPDKEDSGSVEEGELYWGISVPAGISGTCSSSVIFYAT